MLICLGVTFDTNVTWYPTDNDIIVVIIQVVIFKEDILSNRIT